MRGKVQNQEALSAGNGITPAYAGKSETDSGTAPGPKDHPRVCGEKCDRLGAGGSGGGSPPRMRGKDPYGVHTTTCKGITPAYAGKRSFYRYVSGHAFGSPPRMRGKADFCIRPERQTGITPAYAGKRWVASNSGQSRRDHPRVCGEKSLSSRMKYWTVGSPPRMRGKAVENKVNEPQFRITPAYAGKRDLIIMFLNSPTGSPPRMRGKDVIASIVTLIHGITPAYAGKRLKRSRSTVSPVAIVPLFPSVCNKPVVSDGSPAVRDAPLFLPAENAVPASPACNLRSL